ncbi:hypothetical protein CEXT_778601 [Caerostris extrusa]|uniref:Uncharacterized protein n=1 Tax=Caerostris extrusa TaxID=172846 RepID=A0AAV4V5G8_CAEEX|nr:hypothetical protein CEXT_778601 [Caerostris extrusa]
MQPGKTSIKRGPDGIRTSIPICLRGDRHVNLSKSPVGDVSLQTRLTALPLFINSPICKDILRYAYKKSNVALSTGRPHIKEKGSPLVNKSQSSRDTSQSGVIRGDFNRPVVITAGNSLCLPLHRRLQQNLGGLVFALGGRGVVCRRGKHRLNVGRTRLEP